MTLTASVMMIGGTPKSVIASPFTMPISAPAARRSGIAQRSGAVLAAGEQRHEDGGAVQHPRHGQVDAAADDDKGLAQRDDADEGGEDGDGSQMARRQEARREQAGQEEKRDHAR